MDSLPLFVETELLIQEKDAMIQTMSQETDVMLLVFKNQDGVAQARLLPATLHVETDMLLALKLAMTKIQQTMMDVIQDVLLSMDIQAV